MTLESRKFVYTLLVKPDDDPPNPRKEWDNFGTMVCFHHRYELGDAHSYADNDHFLQDLFAKTVGGSEHGKARYERLLSRLDTPEHGGYGSHAWARAVDDALLAVIRKKYVVLPVYLYDHSGLTVSTQPFHCPWDSGQVGWIYTSRDAVLKEFGGEKLTSAKLEQAETLLRGEVDTYDHYLCGDCVGYELYKHGSLVDSCWGFLGSNEQIRAAIEEYMPAACKGITQTLEEQHVRPRLHQRLRQASDHVRDTPTKHATPGRDSLQI